LRRSGVHRYMSEYCIAAKRVSLRNAAAPDDERSSSQG
jgi:hypothetical protein